MYMLLSFVLLMCIAAGNAYFAKQRGRDPVGWFLIGLLLGIFGLVILFLLPKKKGGNELEVDEDQILRGIPENEEDFTLKDWYYIGDEDQQVGPISFRELSRRWDQGILIEETYVWCEGMDNWERIGDLQALRDVISPQELLR